MIGIDAVDKYFWTTFDFVVDRPRRFHQNRIDEPNRYMAPLAFAIVSFVLFEAILVAAVKILDQYWDLSYVTFAAIRTPEGLDLPGILAATGAGTIFAILLTAVWIKAAAFVVRRRAALRDIIVAICYGMAFNALAAAALGFSIFVGVLTGSMLPRESASAVGRLCYIGYQALQIVGFGYFISSAAAVAKISFPRLFLGVILVVILSLVATTGLTIVLALILK